MSEEATTTTTPRTAEEIANRINEIQARMERLDQEFAGQALPEAERAEFQALKDEQDELVRTRDEIEERRAWIAELSTDERNQERPPTPQVSRPGVTRDDDIWDLSTIRASAVDPEQAATEYRERALRALEVERSLDSPEKTRAEQILGRDNKSGEIARRVLMTSSPAYKRAFARALSHQPLSNEEQRQLSLGGGDGIMVPITIDPTIIGTADPVINPWRTVANVVQITGNTYRVITVDDVTVTYDPELTEVTPDEPSFGHGDVTVEKAQGFVRYSIEVDQDFGALQTQLRTLLAQAKDRLEAEKFLNGAGAGSNEPEGLLTALFASGRTEEVVTDSGGFEVADLFALEEALLKRAGASFVASRAFYNAVRQFDESGGANLWMRIGQGLPNDRGGNTGSQLLGYPAYELSTMDDGMTSTGQHVAIFGDFSRFTIVDRICLNVELVPHVFGNSGLPQGMRGLYAYWRNASITSDTDSFRVLTIGTGSV
jgi:HK97 family phage major capsid protein